MHLNVYSDEGGVESVEAGKKKAKDGKVYPFIAIYFKNGNAIKFFGKTVKEVQTMVDKLQEAMRSLYALEHAQNMPVKTEINPDEFHPLDFNR